MSAVRNTQSRAGEPHDDEAIVAFDRLAHDLRSPLASVRTALQMLRMTGLDPAKARELVDLADRQLMRAVALADAVGDYARLRNGSLAFAREEMSVQRVLGDVSDRIRGVTGGIAPRMDVSADAGNVAIDAMRASQAIAMLLETATRSGKPVALAARRTGNSIVIEATAELDARGHAIPDLLGEALLTAQGATIERREDGLTITLPASP